MAPASSVLVHVRSGSSAPSALEDHRVVRVRPEPGPLAADLVHDDQVQVLRVRACARPAASRSDVSAANPTRTRPPGARRARAGCRASARAGAPACRTPSSACLRRRPSDGSRRRRRPSRRRPRRRAADTTAPRISSAVSTCTASPPGGAGTVSGPRIRRTSAPRDDASAATATPILPVERFPMNRTGSIGSCVGPAVTSIRTPSRSCRRATARSTARKMSSGSARRPRPSSPAASGPDDRTDEHGASLGERRDVRGRRGMLPHAGVHRGRQDQRAGRLEQGRREQVVGDPRGELRDDVGRRGSDDGDVDVVRQMDVHDLAGVVPERRLDGIAGERRERVGADEPLGRVRQDRRGRRLRRRPGAERATPPCMRRCSP